MLDNLNYKKFTANLVFCLFPLSFILGNLAINLNILAIFIVLIFFYFSEKLSFEINIFDKILLFFFFYTFITLIFNFIETLYETKNFEKIIIFKTISYLRFLILYFVIRILYLNKIIKIKLFYFSCAFFSVFVLLDIFIQYLFNKNLFGMEAQHRHFSGVFGDEWIAGSYLQNFSLFFLFSPFFHKIKFEKKILFQLFSVILFTIGIILSGNRMPLILFISSFTVYFYFQNKFRKYFYISYLVFICFLTTIFFTNSTFNINTKTFYKSSIVLLKTIYDYENMNEAPLKIWQKSHVTEFYCGRTVAQENLLLGGGIRSYRTYSKGCSTHPHNYYLEIIADIGLIGLIILMILAFKLFQRVKIKYMFFEKNNIPNLNYKLTPFVIFFLTEFFPIRSTGSFFATNNSTMIYLMMGILVSILVEKQK